MTFGDWQQLSPADAACEVRRRARTRLAPAQSRAVLASLLSEEQLAESLTRAVPAAPLAGVPYFLKDLFDVAGVPTFAGSTFLPAIRPTPERDSAIVASLRAAGAVFAGKTHLHEFAYGITGENPHYGDCEHPQFPGRTTGGSSSGSAAAVAAGIVPLAIGTDTGGSVRVPAAFCGLYGFRLIPGDTLIADAFPLAPSFDTAGWFTANAADMLAATETLVPLQPPTRSPRGCYLEWPGLDADVALACRNAARPFAAPADAALRDELLHGFRGAAATYGTIVADEAWGVHAPWADRFRERYDPIVWQRLIRGRALTVDELVSASTRLAVVRRLWADYYRDFDFLILPATPFGALAKPACTLESRSRLIALTAPASLGGLSVLTVPVALPSGLTTGLQLILATPNSPVIRWALTLQAQ